MNCPACNQPLRIEASNCLFWWAWCAYGPCKSRAANDGACGATKEEAVEKLISELNETPDWPEN